MKETHARVVVSALLLLAGVVVYLVAVWTTRGQTLDQRAFDGMLGSDSWRMVLHRFGFYTVTDPRLWAVGGSAVIVLGLIARRGASILALLILPVVGVVAARLLRTVILPRPELIEIVRAGFNTFPSGHTAAAAGCVAAVVRAAPRPLSPVIAIGGAMWLTVVGQGLMEVGAHRPSDIIGSLLLVGALLILPPGTRFDTGYRPLSVLVVIGVGAVGPLLWWAHTGHAVLAVIGVVAAGVFGLLTLGPTRRSGSRSR
ncbi:phosphatase PAP2 family protein [Williamsia sp. CHRR-6]|uniref:phosphatase PAP2 family protein n=1 Tax=Williamsia sp. CHRR-6 TaxID=2835871 RepID=UPI001BDA67DE|nr:phosphatase PAP2 family protein [Williamsia sp. CHRR-6]MBT0566431.1 phosphatase PAP2 family protein [Williamsia sp. CHRR-6]